MLSICHNFRSRLCKPTAAYKIMWPCGLFFPVISHLCVQSWALAAIFAIALSFVLLLLMPVMQVCPFVATCVAKSSCPQPKFCRWIFRPCFCHGPVFASVFCHNCCHYRCHCRFFVVHVALKIAIAIATAIVFALEVAMVVAIKFRRLIEHCSWILDKIYMFFYFFFKVSASWLIYFIYTIFQASARINNINKIDIFFYFIYSFFKASARINKVNKSNFFLFYLFYLFYLLNFQLCFFGKELKSE